MLRLLSICVALAAFLIGAPASAVPAPKSPDELLAHSDLVARVQVISVTCTAVWQDERTGETLHGYNAELQVIEVKKGGATAGDVVTVRFKDLPPGIVGPWEVFYYPGEAVWTHLQRDDGGDAYTSTWWNARGETLRAAAVNELPTVLGGTVRSP
jgi:hypothetical protein